MFRTSYAYKCIECSASNVVPKDCARYLINHPDRSAVCSCSTCYAGNVLAWNNDNISVVGSTIE